MKIGILTVSDRASRGEYADLSGPAISDYLTDVLTSAWQPVVRIVSDGVDSVAAVMLDLVDREGVSLLLATGGTGPAQRDQTTEAMARVVEKDLPGFGELMRRVSLETVPTAILSRQGAGIRGSALLVTLPGKPAAIKVCLDAIFPAVPYCLDLLGAGRLETNPDRIRSFRPGS